jgi:uncharacterized membrane protein YciS (DUF1049 family)
MNATAIFIIGFALGVCICNIIYVRLLGTKTFAACKQCKIKAARDASQKNNLT